MASTSNQACETDDNIQRKLIRTPIPPEIPIYRYKEDLIIEDKLTTEFIEELTDAGGTKSLGTMPCIVRLAFLPRFLAEAKLPGWDIHSEYNPSRCPDKNIDITFEASSTFDLDILRAIRTTITVLGLVLKREIKPHNFQFGVSTPEETVYPNVLVSGEDVPVSPFAVYNPLLDSTEFNKLSDFEAAQWASKAYAIAIRSWVPNPVTPIPDWGTYYQYSSWARGARR